MGYFGFETLCKVSVTSENGYPIGINIFLFLPDHLKEIESDRIPKPSFQGIWMPEGA